MFEDLKEPSTTKSKSAKGESNSVCEICFGTGTRLDPEKGAAPCSCQSSSRSERMLRAARIPLRYSNCSLDSFKSVPGSSAHDAFMFATMLVSAYPAVDQGLLFMGPVGVGKTHLAVSIMRGILSRGFAAVFYEFGSLLKQIQDSYNPISKTSELRVLAPVYQADVLVLDELGATVPTDWVRDTMYQIINKRYNDKKLTIFTTNYLDDPPEPANTETEGKRTRKIYTLEERISTPLRSRLYEMCRQIKIEGEDYRKHGGRSVNAKSAR